MYKYNKRQPRLLKTVVVCVIGGMIGLVVGYMTFVWGFNKGAVKYAPIVQTTTVQPVCGLQLHEWVK